jgi:hypothetical protein
LVHISFSQLKIASDQFRQTKCPETFEAGGGNKKGLGRRLC